MRNIKKTLNVKQMLVKVYDTVDKTEKEIPIAVSEVETRGELPEGCVFISETFVSEKEVRYTMSPKDFVKHATIEN